MTVLGVLMQDIVRQYFLKGRKASDMMGRG